ncbi:MATE family efflux transporter [uncultured Phascolarctobacterium sp.]|uniref:MATE family efflux transporter n=1 Tax=uncultured Phascolarctobacterium sp. TaxID=512296 RepID=UPI002602F477|nr:MATE family efflux transporter [uncultured Phascolarctobacterium sp.]
MNKLQKHGQKLSIFTMSWPIFIEILLQMMVGNVDQFMLSRYSQHSVAAVGNANQIINIVIIALSVISMAATILIAQHRGAGNKEKVAETCTTALLTNIVIGGIISLILFFGDGFFLNLLEVPADIRGEASLFLRYIGLFIIVQSAYISFISFFRGYSLLKITMVTSIIMNVINITANCFLIHGFGPIPPLGVLGVTISTNSSKVLGLALIIYFFRKYLDVKLSWSYLKPFPKHTLFKILYLGLPSGCESLSYQISQMVIMRFVNLMGLVVITTKIYAYIIANCTYVYTQSLAMATQIIVGFLIGTGNLDAVSSRVWKTIRIGVLISGVLTFILYLNSDFIYGIFTDNPEVLELGRHIFLIEIFLEMGRAVNMVMVMSLQAAGDIKWPVATGLISMWLTATLGAYVFGIVLGWGLVGVWLAMCLDECLRAAVFIYRWHSGGWRKIKLIE